MPCWPAPASIRELGDPDILEEASHSIGILHFMQGAYSEALPLS